MTIGGQIRYKLIRIITNFNLSEFRGIGAKWYGDWRIHWNGARVCAFLHAVLNASRIRIL